MAYIRTYLRFIISIDTVNEMFEKIVIESYVK